MCDLHVSCLHYTCEMSRTASRNCLQNHTKHTLREVSHREPSAGIARIQSAKLTQYMGITDWTLQLRNKGLQEAVRYRCMDASELYGVPFVGQLLSYGGFPRELDRCFFGFLCGKPILCRQAVANNTVKSFEQRSRRPCIDITVRLGPDNGLCSLVRKIKKAYQTPLQKSP